MSKKGYEYKSYIWWSAWRKKYYFCNVLKLDGKVVWMIPDSDHSIKEKDAILIYESERLG